MFDKILIANRGEIATRVIATARRMRIATVAICSEADRTAQHTTQADEAVCIGLAPAADSYLAAERIIATALERKAEAIHPGYGFLSETPEFAEAVTSAGLVFIGPPAHAIRTMGLKNIAKATMQQAGTPVVPGYHGDLQDPTHLAKQAEHIGYPVLIKAVAGGGGKGMRLVSEPRVFPDELASAQAEAARAFGNDAVLLEKYIARPRHIEIQVFGDQHGQMVHLFERDCSLQRRHQKVFEEAPAPGISVQMRARLGLAAVQAARAIGYYGAGTVEFIVDCAEDLSPKQFWFMEMNTRLQVEHPVTEAVTGVDLVEWQLRVAAGEALPLTQSEIRLSGHAVEARLYAEDAAKGFLPATGRLDYLVFPGGVRVDSGVRAGDEITSWYDPLIAKVIAHGADRATAWQRLSQSMAATRVGGSVTNLPFLRALAQHPDVKAGKVETGLIEREFTSLTADGRPQAWVVALAAIVVAGLGRPATGAHWAAGFGVWQRLAQTVRFRHEQNQHEAQITTLGSGRFVVRINDNAHTIERFGGGWWFDGVRLNAVRWRQTRGRVHIFAGQVFTFDPIDPLERTATGTSGSNVIEAPMPGLVRKVFVAEGQRITAGARVAVLEAMKMEHGLLASRDGVVSEILVSPGAQVDAGAPLVRLQSSTDDETR